MTNTNWMPKFLRWLFTVFAIVMALGAVVFLVLLAFDPRLSPGLNFGPHDVLIDGVPGVVTFSHSTLNFSVLQGAIALTLRNTDGLIETLKHYGLPILILDAAFFAVLFDLLRRLFRNVGRGESFTRETVRLVQIIGISLLIFSVVSALAEGWFQYALFWFLAHNASVAISGTPVHLPLPQNFEISGGGGTPFDSPYFFAGLLVLALSEVFRQGLVLKREHDLTV